MKLKPIRAAALAAALILPMSCKTNEISSKSVLDASRYTDAPLAVHKTVTIKAPAERIWKTVEDHQAYDTWMPMVKDIRVSRDSEAEDGASLVREFKFGPDQIRETMLEVRPNQLLAYHAADTPMFIDHLAAVEIIDAKDGTQEVSYSVYFKPQNFKGRLMGKMMLPMMLNKSLKNLKSISE